MKISRIYLLLIEHSPSPVKVYLWRLIVLVYHSEFPISDCKIVALTLSLIFSSRLR